MVKKCVICGKDFEAIRSTQKCCSTECSLENDRIYKREYARRHKEKNREYHKKWYQNNRKKALEYARKYYFDNKEKHSEWDRENYLKNKELKREQREYRLKVKPEMEACKKAHNGCFDCPTEDGECLYD